MGEVSWNGEKIISVEPVDHDVHTQEAEVEVLEGENVLEFAGAGKSDKLGLTIDDVRLIKVGTEKNIVVNGGFEKPDVAKSWKVQSNILGWEG